VFAINLCGWIYSCGCNSLWAGGSEHCNIHTPGVKHCPWCASGLAGFPLVLASILGLQLAISFWPRQWSWPLRLALALVAFPLLGALAGVAFGLLSGYWA